MKITSPSPAWRRFAACALVGLAAAAHAQNPTATADIPATKFVRPTGRDDYVKREVMIPMRDGVKLFTSIVIPKGAKDAPVIMTRTPYNAAGRTTRNRSMRMLDTLPEGDEVFVRDGYIRIFQDVRGKYGSEGEYWMTALSADRSTPLRSITRPMSGTPSNGW